MCEKKALTTGWGGLLQYTPLTGCLTPASLNTHLLTIPATINVSKEHLVSKILYQSLKYPVSTSHHQYQHDGHSYSRVYNITVTPTVNPDVSLTVTAIAAVTGRVCTSQIFASPPQSTTIIATVTQSPTHPLSRTHPPLQSYICYYSHRHNYRLEVTLTVTPTVSTVAITCVGNHSLQICNCNSDIDCLRQSYQGTTLISTCTTVTTTTTAVTFTVTATAKIITAAINSHRQSHPQSVYSHYDVY